MKQAINDFVQATTNADRENLFGLNIGSQHSKRIVRYGACNRFMPRLDHFTLHSRPPSELILQ